MCSKLRMCNLCDYILSEVISVSAYELTADINVALHHYNKQGHDVYYGGVVKVTLPKEEPVSFEVLVVNPDDKRFLEVVIRKEGSEVVRIQPDSEVRFEDGSPERIIVIAVFAPVIFAAIKQIKLQEGVVLWDDVTLGIRALVGLEPLYHISLTETVEWMYRDRRGFDYFKQAVLAEY